MPGRCSGTPDRSFQEELAKRIVAEGLTVRAVEEGVRHHASDAEAGQPPRTRTAATSLPRPPRPTRRQTGPGAPAVRRRLPAPGVLELEDLLSNHLNTRVKVEMGAKRGRVVIDFATLEDLERIYKLMVGGVTA